MAMGFGSRRSLVTGAVVRHWHSVLVLGLAVLLLCVSGGAGR